MNNKNDKICGHCASFRTSDGWCRPRGQYVNALAEKDCFTPRDDSEAPEPAERPRKTPKVRQMAEPPKTRICKRCGVEKPIGQFARHRKARDGYSCTCKECFHAIMSENGKKYGRQKGLPVKSAESAESAISAVTESTEIPQAVPLDRIADDGLVAELRRRGWQVTCVKTI